MGLLDFTGEGLATSHQVGIWDSGGHLLVETTVAAGTAGTLINNYRYTDIDILTLDAGSTYTIGAFFSASNADLILFASNQTFDPRITYGEAVQTLTHESSVFDFPSVNAGVPHGVFGPNFLIAAPIPEPSTWLSLAGGAVLLGVIGRRKRRWQVVA